MKTLRSLALITLLFISSVFADTEMRDAAALTGSYVASGAVNIEYVQQISIEVIVSGTGQALTANLVPQWSVDNSKWVDEPVNVAGTATATEQPYTRLSKRFDFSVSATGLAFGETFTRWGGYKWFRVKIKESTGAGTTTALIQIKGATAKIEQ